MKLNLADGYQRVFGYRAFRSFWIGYTFSILGDTMTRVALTWFVYEATKSAQALGWLTLCYTGPVIVGGLLAGWLLDRFERRAVIMVDSLLRAVVVGLVPLLYAFDQLALWHIYLVAAVYGLLMMIPLAGGPSLVPSLVPREHLATANSLEVLSFTLSGVIGPPLAGFLIARLAAPNVIILDVLSYLFFAWMLIAARPAVTAEAATTQPTRAYRLQDAFRLLVENKILLSTTLMFLVGNLGFGALFVWLPIFADQVLGGGATLYGTLLGVLAVGEVVSSLLAGSLALYLTLGTLICLTQFLAGAAVMLLLWGRQVGWAIASLVLLGFFSAPMTIWAQTLRMQIIPEALRGRTFALLRMLMQSGNPLGGAVGGFLLPILGIPTMIGLSAALIGLPGLIGYQIRALRQDEVPDRLQQEAA